MPRFLIVLLLVFVFLAPLSFAQSDEQKAQDVLMNASAALGWPTTVTPAKDNSIGSQYYISSDGTGESADVQGSVIILPSDMMSGFWLSWLEQQADFERSNYLGRDAVISQYGENCHPKPFVKAMNDMVNSWFEGIFGPPSTPDNGCVTDHGAIVFSCGKYLFTAADNRESAGGQENDIAAALFKSATDAGLCGYGDTLVILAGTSDKPGGTPLANYEKIAQGVNQYYAANSYGKQTPFTYTFMEAGKDIWYDVAPSQSGMTLETYPVAAVQKAFQGADVPQDLSFKRIVVVYSGDSKQIDPKAEFITCDSWEPGGYSIEVDASSRKAQISTTDVVMISETSALGTWAHEFGHTLYSKYQSDGFNKINDRYNYADKPESQLGTVGPWDIMGVGNYWGDPQGSTPTQMSTYTKEGAGYLTYTTMTKNQSYDETAIEDMKAGDSVLRFDDPTSTDPNYFYIVETRDSSAKFGAPENGVVIYRVSYDELNKHEVVNNIDPQSGDTTAVNGFEYTRPTLHLSNTSDPADTASLYTDVPGKFRVAFEKDSTNPYVASVHLWDYLPVDMTGAEVTPSGPAVEPIPGEPPASVAASSLGPKPDIDLHAYDNNGGHVGLNYQTGQYENTIPGAIASGDLKDAEEWIFVPKGTQVRYVVSAYKTQQYLNAHPEYAAYATPENFTTTLVKIDSAGNQVAADGGPGSVAAGQTTQTKSPDDPSLVYNPAPYPGFGNNAICPLFPGMVLLLVLYIYRRQ